MDVILVRHGQSLANARLTQDLDSHLTLLGFEQAQLTAERLNTGLARRRQAGASADIWAVVSPFWRTLMTMSPICHTLGITAHVYPAVCEYFSAKYPEYRMFQGLSAQEISEQFPFVSGDLLISCAPEWWPGELEFYMSVVSRANQTRKALLDRFASTSTQVLVVSHAETIGRLVQFLGIGAEP